MMTRTERAARMRHAAEIACLDGWYFGIMSEPGVLVADEEAVRNTIANSATLFDTWEECSTALCLAAAMIETGDL